MKMITESITDDVVGKTSACSGVVTRAKIGADRTSTGVKSKPIQRKDYESKRRDKWLNRLTDEFFKLEGLFPWKNFLPKENPPEWVHRVEEEYALATYSAVRLKSAKKLTPMLVGAILGHQCAYAVWMIESLNAMIKDTTEHPEKYKVVELKKDEEEEVVNMFLATYSRAFGKKPKLGAGMGDFGSSSFGIYHFMLYHWRVVERLDSVRALHDLLRRSMGESRVGDLKRIEKICQRVGLHYRKSGRPKSSK